MNTPDPIDLADTILAPLRFLYRNGRVKPDAITVTRETFDAIVDLPEIARKWKRRCDGLEASLASILSMLDAEDGVISKSMRPISEKARTFLARRVK